MNTSLFMNSLKVQQQPISDGIIYASTPLVMPFYGCAIGGYIEDIGNDRVRISDNADTLFEAIAQGVEHSQKRTELIQHTASRFGMELSEAGEITATCQRNELEYFFIRFIEATLAVANTTLDWHPATKVNHKFKQEVGAVLACGFKERITKNVKVMGSSGHQLTFHFVLDADKPNEKLIQTIGLSETSLDWNHVYGTLGKMVDISRIRSSKRIVIIENADTEELLNASALLNEKATIIPFVNDAALLKAVAA